MLGFASLREPAFSWYIRLFSPVVHLVTTCQYRIIKMIVNVYGYQALWQQDTKYYYEEATLQTELTFWSLSPGSLLSAYILQFDLFKMPNLNRKRTSDSSSLWSISNLYRTSFSKQRSSGLSAKLDFKTVRGDCNISELPSPTPNYMTTSFQVTTMFQNPSSKLSGLEADPFPLRSCSMQTRIVVLQLFTLCVKGAV